MSNLRVIISSLFIATAMISNTYSQEKTIFTNSYLDPFIVNPACTGAEYYTVAHLAAKKQWLGISNSPSSFFLSGNSKIGKYDFYDPKGFVNQGPLKLKDRIGLGAALFQDKNGPLSNTGGLLSYAYQVPVNKESSLSFGMSVLMLHYSLNSSLLKPDQINDPYLLTGNDDIFNLNFGFGVYYQTYNYYAGASVMKILSGITNINEPVLALPSYFLSGGYVFKNSNSFIFEPSLTLKKLGGSVFSIDAHAKVYIKNFNWLAVTYSTSQKINLLFGVRMYKMMYMAYNFESSLSKIATYNYGSHQISLGINLGLRGIEGVRESTRKENL